MGANARQVIADGLEATEIAISAISIWEIGMLGRINLEPGLIEWRAILLDQGLIEIPVSGDIAANAATVSGLHGDPADRIIVATALEDHTLVTADQHILNWQDKLHIVKATD